MRNRRQRGARGAGEVVVLILYWRCNIDPTKTLAVVTYVSILYMEIQTLSACRSAGSSVAMCFNSLLEMPGVCQIRARRPVGASGFNSLLEMRVCARLNYADAAACSVSILYWRCWQR